MSDTTFANLYVLTALRSDGFTNPSFAREGLDGQTAGKLEHMLIYGHPSTSEPGYDQYISHFGAYVMATATKQLVKCTPDQYHFFSKKPDEIAPIMLPPIQVAPLKSKLTEQEKGEMLALLPGRIEEKVHAGRRTFILQDVSLSDFSRIPTSKLDPANGTLPDCVHINGLRSFVTTWKLLSVALTTHSYAFSQTPEDEEWPLFRDHIVSLYKGGCVTADDDAFVRSDMMEKFPGIDMEHLKFDLEKLLKEDEDDYVCSASNRVPTAKPAPYFPSINIGPVRDVPALPGYCFKYFRGLTDPSEKAIISVVMRRFRKSFGPDYSSNLANYCKWAEGVRNWYRTDVGKALAHLLFVFDVALESQARCFAMFAESRYVGATVQGFKFQITKDHKLVLPLSPVDMRRAVNLLDKHTSALENLAELLSELDLKETDSVQQAVASSELSSYRAVHRQIARRKRPVNDEVIGNLCRWVGQLRFEENYLSFGQRDIERWIRCLCGEAIPNDAPMYLPPNLDLMYSTDVSFLATSMFGPDAPSLVDAAGKIFEIPKGETAEDPLSVIDLATGSCALPSIFISHKKLAAAVNDAKFLMNNRKIRIRQDERAGGSRTSKYTGPFRDAIWSLLKRLPFAAPAQPNPRKRGHDGEVTEEELARIERRRMEKAETAKVTLDEF